MQVSKWGNSLAVRLPKALVEELGLKEGDKIDLVKAAPGQFAVAKDTRRAEALARMAARGLERPADFKFDREEANRRPGRKW
ncbi:MAG TPA: AbrB/MazE/SpoVT family DNA-binding domain-containing protein [Beijerinckiaceae bacterium]|nr:AbrB/MazE/SpoVT family DNA-binding domain-containing protein [Beijerinckiaceae bacterium]